jgi:hypothetical protein
LWQSLLVLSASILAGFVVYLGILASAGRPDSVDLVQAAVSLVAAGVVLVIGREFAAVLIRSLAAEGRLQERVAL